MKYRNTSFGFARWAFTMAVLGVTALQAASCVSKSSGRRNNGDGGGSTTAVRCPVACSNQATACAADGGNVPSAQTCISSCVEEADNADGKDCGTNWEQFLQCCSQAQGTANCQAGSLTPLDSPTGCAPSCNALLQTYRGCVQQGQQPGDDAGIGGSGGTSSDSGAAGSAGSMADAGMSVPGSVMINGFVRNTVNVTGAPVANAEIEIGGAVVGTTDAMGLFAVEAAPAGDAVVLQLSAADHAPQVVRVPMKPDVGSYSVPVIMQRIQTISLPMGATNANINVNGTMTNLTFEPAMAQDANLRFVSIPPDEGPGELRFIDGDPDQQLQSGGMIWFELNDMAGEPIPMPGANIAIDVGLQPEIMGADPWQGFVMDPENGQWSEPVEPAMTSGTLLTFPLPQFGFWNVDRNFRTACVRGTVSAAAAAACGGARITATGPDSVTSFDSLGEDGGFCVMGAQTFSTTLSIGSATTFATMPSNAGDCSAPDTCLDLGEIGLTAADCDLMSLMPPPPEAGDPCTAQEQCTPGSDCFNGFCVGAGAMRVSLAFTANSDFDLHLLTPLGNEIYYGARTYDGGTLDVDQCVGSSCDASTHVENIVFDATAPVGTYEVWVVNFNGGMAGDFTIDVSGAAMESFAGSLTATSGEQSMRFMFTVTEEMMAAAQAP